MNFADSSVLAFVTRIARIFAFFEANLIWTFFKRVLNPMIAALDIDPDVIELSYLTLTSLNKLGMCQTPCLLVIQLKQQSPTPDDVTARNLGQYSLASAHGCYTAAALSSIQWKAYHKFHVLPFDM